MRDRWATPQIAIELVADHTPTQPTGFLRLRRWELRSRYADGSESDRFFYDAVERRATDAVVLLLYEARARTVCLRSSLRPPLAFRHELTVPLEPAPVPVIWELPAGLVEPDEEGLEGLCRCAARETLEEAGIELPPSAFRHVGNPLYLSPGVIAERIYFLAANVEGAPRGAPTEDGTPVEAGAAVTFFPLEEALAGPIGDAKSELGLYRLRELLAEGAR